MSTFLEHLVDLHRESGAAGIAPTAVTGLTGEHLRLANWVISADLYVQRLKHRWNFLRTEYSAATVASTRDATKPTTIQNWDLDTFALDTDQPLVAVKYNSIKREVFDITIEDVPWRVIILPNGNLRFDPVPDAAYTITADGYLKPVPLAADADVSLIPEEFHQVILGRALILYANYENAAEIKSQGNELYTEFIVPLMSQELASDQDDVEAKGEGGFFEVIAE